MTLFSADGSEGEFEDAQPAAPSADDQQLAAILIRMWSLASGRRLRSGVRPDQLSESELIAFWADDFTQRTGRHAAPDPLRIGTAA